MRRRLITALFGSLLLTGALAPSVAAAPPTTPSMTGEHLAATQPTHHFQVHCNADGSGYITWQSFGAATIAYTGTYFEAGVATIGPAATNGARTFQVFAWYQINSVSPPARIRGSKQFGPYTLFQACNQAIYSFFAIGMTYQASIEANDETYRDQGYSNISVSVVGMGEDFFSTQGATLQPTGDGSGDRGGDGNGDHSGNGASPMAPVQAPSAGLVTG